MTTPITITTGEQHGIKKGDTITFTGTDGIGKRVKVEQVENSTTLLIRDFRWYEKLWYWFIGLFNRQTPEDFQRRAQEFMDGKLDHYLQFFHNQKWQRFFKQHLN